MAAAPLRGLLVVDLTRHLPGPLGARLLADLGARVIKVEEPQAGDPVRAAAPLVGGKSPLAAMLLAGVESVALDLKQPAAVEALRGLLARADVLLESFRPGTMARLGLAPEVLRERYPRLVICSLAGWGQTGPYSARAGHDITYQAIGGALASTGVTPPIPVADVV
ncbi:MAG TPA: CaiB/BaiF CoA-transferase family protein, partial [Thermoanaerobaculia bacterium]|nr:CaiB/BaiF CoA-transferase family protein [Thermoanaerobaculia bacterium]